MNDDLILELAMWLYIAYYPDAGEESWRATRQAEKERWATVALEAIYVYNDLQAGSDPRTSRARRTRLHGLHR